MSASSALTPSAAHPASGGTGPAPLAERLFMLFFGLLLVRGLFSGWDLTYDFNLHKLVRWGVDLSIYTVPAAVSLAYLRGRRLIPGAVVLVGYTAVSLAAGLLAYDSVFGIEKSLSLTFINTLQLSCIVVTCAAVMHGDVRISDRALDRVARFGVLYVFACLLIGGAIGLYYLNGGTPISAGGKFFFVSPIALRMGATFSEPSYLGFYMGFCALHVHARHPGKWSAAFLIFVGAVLYLVVGAKFAIIAFPLTLLLVPLVRRASLGTVRIALYAFVLALFAAIALGFDEYVYQHVFAQIEYEDQQTFVARFSYIFSSFRHLASHPLGTGFGGWMFSLPPNMADTLEMTRGLANEEIAEQLATGFNFAPKDSTSLVLLIAGWVGVIGVVEGLVALLRQARRGRESRVALVIYIALSIAVYINAIAVPMFFALALVASAELFQSQRHLRAAP
ncbi:hypothetical protein FHT39_003618 [Mitsuaria sp. BK045]|uniref:hypothetical protein n=1 Tax=unclassified Roseateles TaxID=2626991 RepID=UPI00160FD007|nr:MULTISPECIES: hypothetical protein [unclassified Roseateles]MBB3294938.1 hypothetical protein [Mitsuaria sp. BK041]MBB3364154.1 hypothetical protein [Mitsuaria sp. BK045]